jgi:hypothetical protein
LVFALGTNGFVYRALLVVVGEDSSESSDPLLLLHLDQNSDSLFRAHSRAALQTGESNVGHFDNARLVAFVVPERTFYRWAMSTEVGHARDLAIDCRTQGGEELTPLSFQKLS